MNTIIPVFLFAYARPDHLRRTLICLLENKIPFLYGFADGLKMPGVVEHVSEDRQILRSHGIRVMEELTYSQQPWWHSRFFYLRMRAFNILLNKPVVPLLQHLRPLIIRFLAKVGMVCVGFA